jgi:sugar transferase (PEP-CTERM/EpsH1 system associated)
VRLLFLTSRLPYPPNRGDRLRAYHFLEHLSQEHEISLASFIAKEAERQNLEPLQAFCREVRVVPMSSARSALSVAANLWRREPLQLLYYRSRAMRHLVGQMADATHFDVAYIHLFRMAPYAAGLTGVYRVVDLTDAISKEIDRSLPYRGFLSRLLYRVEAPRIAAYERRVAASAEETWLISEADRRVLAADCPNANLQVVTNGVDLGRFHPARQSPRPNSLIFVGHLGVFHNVDAASYLVQEILPLVQRRLPGCTLRLVGADPSPQVQRLANPPAVTVTGYVPDLNECLNQAAVFVAPRRFAAGVQNKVLEAMAAACPVVTTTLVNEGLGARPDQEILLADGAEPTARQVVRLLGDDALRGRIGMAGREFVRRTYSWDHVLQRMRAIEASLPRWRARGAG